MGAGKKQNKKHLCLMMAGSGQRFGGPLPKQFVNVDNKPIFRHILDAYIATKEIDKIVVVTNPNYIDFTKKWISDIDQEIMVIEGGSTRSISVKNAIMCLDKCIDCDDNLFIHDATHPYLDVKMFPAILKYTCEYDAVTVCQRQYDTCYSINENDEIVSIVPRNELVTAASPEIFKFKLLRKIYLESSEDELSSMTSAGAFALSKGYKIKVIPTTILNLKITHPEDLELYLSIDHDYFYPGVSNDGNL